MLLRPCCSFKNQRGSAYLYVMFAIVVMSLSIMAAAKQWKTVVQREKEADLLARGIEIQQAIGAYYTARQQPVAAVAKGPQNIVTAGSGWYPLTLEELITGPKPLLRKVYKDPMTGEDWDYVRDPSGRIKGVRSRAKSAPIKQHQFPQQVSHFDGLTQYHDWVFQYPPASMPQYPQALSGKEPKEEPQAPPSLPQVHEPTGSTPASR
jgi:type II secretory pathway pseudopilin PulG